MTPFLTDDNYLLVQLPPVFMVMLILFVVFCFFYALFSTRPYIFMALFPILSFFFRIRIGNFDITNENYFLLMFFMAVVNAFYSGRSLSLPFKNFVPRYVSRSFWLFFVVYLATQIINSGGMPPLKTFFALFVFFSKHLLILWTVLFLITKMEHFDFSVKCLVISLFELEIFSVFLMLKTGDIFVLQNLAWHPVYDFLMASPFLDPNILVRFFLFLFPFSMFCVNHLRSSRFFYYITAVSMYTCPIVVIATLSRAGAISLIAMTVAIYFYGRRFSLTQFRKLAYLVFTLGLIFMILDGGEVITRFEKLYSAYEKSSKADSMMEMTLRFRMTMAGIEIVRDNPFGIGMDKNRMVEEHIKHGSIINADDEYRALIVHGTLLKLLVKGGWPTGLAFLNFIVSLFVFFYRQIKRARGSAHRDFLILMLSCHVALFIASLAQDTYNFVNYMYVIAITILGNNILEKESCKS